MTSADSDCSICLQKFVLPVQLPCGHVFCFLCIKGCAFHRRRCPMCRDRFSARFFHNPKLMTMSESSVETNSVIAEQAPSIDYSALQSNSTTLVPNVSGPEFPAYRWFYEGNSGWWQYDDRTSTELEEAYMNSVPTCDISIAGFIYTIDFQGMFQKRKDNSGRKRRIKRDVENCEKRGVAGIRLSAIQCDTSSAHPNVRNRPPLRAPSLSPSRVLSSTLLDHSYALPATCQSSASYNPRFNSYDGSRSTDLDACLIPSAPVSPTGITGSSVDHHTSTNGIHFTRQSRSQRRNRLTTSNVAPSTTTRGAPENAAFYTNVPQPHGIANWAVSSRHSYNTRSSSHH